MESTAHRWAAVYGERDRLLRIARSRTLNEAEAEDCVSEAMLRCVEFEGLDEERLGAFLTTVTVRLCADQHRARARLLRTGGRITEPDDEPGPEENVCERAEAAWLATHLRRLPAHQRRVVEARAAGLSCADVAARLNVSVDAVKSAVARARSSVRAALASSFGLLPPLLDRYGRFVTAGVAGSAVAGVAVGGMLFVRPPDVVATPAPAAPVVTVPPAPERVALPPAPVRAGAPTEHLPAPVAKTARGVRAGVARRVPAVRPVRQAPPPVAKAGPYEIGKTADHEDYTIDERVLHCVTEGVQLDPVKCRHPEGDTR